MAKLSIVAHTEEDAATLLANPLNYRVHHLDQRAAMLATLETVGWVSDVLANRRSGRIIDGHLRTELAAQAGQRVPVRWVDLSDEEEALALALYDPAAAMAGTDAGLLASLAAESMPSAGAMADFLSGLAEAAPPVELATALAPVPVPSERAEEVPEPADQEQPPASVSVGTVSFQVPADEYAWWRRRVKALAGSPAGERAEILRRLGFDVA